MSETPRRLIFNRYQVPADATGADFYGDDPVIQLIEGQLYPRSPRQLAGLRRPAAGAPEPAVDDPLFGAAIDWAYREYIVHCLARSDGADDLPPGVAPTQPATAEARGAQLKDVQLVERPPTDADRRLCLFNVIVATEWYPSQRYLRQLEWAFRRACDFLYDVTDGLMAFGRVIFAGPELLGCADIQIMASNRLFARTWVSGLHEAMKYMGIRVGRGVWHKNNHVSIPWDEPEAYRGLVHEWGHYALDLSDEYLETHDVFLPGAVDPASLPAQRLASGSYALVLPRISLATESIMGTLEGTSELVPRTGGPSLKRRQDVWESIRRKGRYPFLFPNPQNDPQPIDGPDRFPLPLPRYHRLGAPAASAARASDEATLAVPLGIDPDHCWVYVVQGPLDKPRRLIAQGTLDARSAGDGFQLLGAAAGDTVILVGAADEELLVLRGTIDAVDPKEQRALITDWRPATPAAPPDSRTPVPIVDVVPSRMDPARPDDQLAEISVRVVADERALPSQVWIFPHGQLDPGAVIAPGAPDRADWTSSPQRVGSLDGHVLLRWSDGSLLLYTYSQGGGPMTHTPPGPPSISAGSPEGNIMLFFEDGQQGRDYSAVRVVTTMLHGMRYRQGGKVARSYAFSIASNEALPTELNPTMIMYFDLAAPRDGGDLLIHRLAESGLWEPLPTYHPPGASYVAAPICAETARTLVVLKPPARRVERYRIYWAPCAPAEAHDTADDSPSDE